MEQTYYKVVYSLGRGFFSSYAKSRYELQYRLGEVTKKKDNTVGIFCFKTREDALLFKFNMGESYMILRGIGEEEAEQAHFIPSSMNYFDAFYIKRSRGVKRPKFMSMINVQNKYPGTVLLKWFKPLSIF